MGQEKINKWNKCLKWVKINNIKIECNNKGID